MIVVVALYYLAYRYPFRINDATTSPTYSATPVALAVAKYAIIAVLVAWLVVAAWRRGHGERPPTALLVVGAVLGVIALARTLALRVGDGVEVLFLVIVLLALLVALFRFPVTTGHLARILLVFAVVALVVDAIQVVLYATTGRLPALGYGGLAVRFGSVWDDPNGFAVSIALLAPIVALSGLARGLRILLLAALAAALVLTQSITGFAAVGLALVVTPLLFGSRRIRLAAATVAAVGALAAVALLLARPPVLVQFWESKLGSVEGHLDSFELLARADLPALLGFGPPIAAESGYVSILLNFGVVFLAGFLAVAVWALVRCFRRARALQGSAQATLYFGMFAFQLAFLLALANLPLQVVFPVNLLFVISMVLSFVPLPASAAGPAGSVAAP